FSQPPSAAFFTFLEGAYDSRRQASDAVFENVVVSTLPNGLNGNVFRDSSRDKNKGDVWTLGSSEAKGAESIEGGEGIISQDNVRLPLPQLFQKCLLIFHTASLKGDTRLFYVASNEFGVKFKVLKEEDFQTVHA